MERRRVGVSVYMSVGPCLRLQLLLLLGSDARQDNE
jgi:hypothetical protein